MENQFSILTKTFFDQELTSDGMQYAPFRFKEIIKERYLISKHTNTSYGDTLHITPTERDYLLEFIAEDIKARKDAIESAKTSK